MKSIHHYLLCFLVLVFIGCKKDDVKNVTPSQQIAYGAKAKDWLQRESSTSNSQKYFLEGKSFAIPQKIHWDETSYFEDYKTSITPISIIPVVGNVTKHKYFVTELGDDGEIKGGNYFLILRDKNAVEPFNFEKITPEFFNLKKTAQDFTGAVIKYDLNNNFITSKHFEQGKLINSIDKVIIKRSKNQIPVENLVPLDEGCGYVTIEWFWQTWVNGVLISEEYLYSSTVVVCSGGGGGGNGGGGGGGPTAPTDLELCQQAVLNTLNMTSSTSQLLSNNIELETTLSRTRLYSWKCVKNVIGWYVVAYERGVQKRIAESRPWTWESLENISISKTGATPSYGGTVTATKILSQSTIGIYNASQYLVVNIKSSVSKNAITVTDERDISSSITFFTDSPPIQGF